MEICNCKTKCIATGEDLVFCHKYWSRFGECKLKYCEKHKAIVFHFNDNCVFCMFEDGILENVMQKASFDDNDIKIFIPRIKFVNERNKLHDLSLIKKKRKKRNAEIKNK